ncbi:MAG: sugar kinase [Betaproteobacteria bacterium]|nr:sugar kinase [Betaproteobacteria bacterium]
MLPLIASEGTMRQQRDLRWRRCRLDQCAGLAVDDAGRRLFSAAQPIRQFHPRAGLVEQSSADIWRATCAAVREALVASGAGTGAIAGIAFDATCSLVAVGAGGSPVEVVEDGAPSATSSWMDSPRRRRSGDDQRATHDPALAYVGGEVSIEMEPPEVLWLRRRFPERYAAATRFFDLADYLVWKCCGTDAASVCTLTCKWNYLAHESRFPQAIPRGGSPGDLRVQAARAHILPLVFTAASRRPRRRRWVCPPWSWWATGIIDAHAGGLALVGSSPHGSLALIGGTSNCHLVVSPQPIMVPGVWGPAWAMPGSWLNEGGQSAAGALVDWTVRQSESWPLVEETAAREGRNVYAVLNDWTADLRRREPAPTRDRQRPLPDHHGKPLAARQCAGSRHGDGADARKGPDALARLYLATIQALAYGTRHIVDSMNAAGHRIERIAMCGGGTRNPLLLQEHADVLGRDLHLVAEEDAVTLGAALLAATASGHFPDLPAAAAAMVRPGGKICARAGERAFHDAKYRVFLQLYEDQQGYQASMASLH